MMQINPLPFSPLSENFTLSLYTEKAEGSRPYTFYTDECSELWQQHTELAEQKEMYFTFDNNTADLK
ncbi:MAG: hypothetical protein LBV41_05260 [Cytophagaceae bacterium]|jgi:hypothetical protein|nr:hypothetical protein [Cytophagaceae bacterium]